MPDIRKLYDDRFRQAEESCPLRFLILTGLAHQLGNFVVPKNLYLFDDVSLRKAPGNLLLLEISIAIAEQKPLDLSVRFFESDELRIIIIG